MIPTNWLRNAVLAVALAALAVSAATAQVPRSRIYSNPELPSDEALRRLNLHLAWRTAVPVDGRRDGLIRVELHGNDLFVLTRSGLVVRMDPETGRVHWRTRVSRPYTLMAGMAVNSRSVYVIANAYLLSLDRAGGTQKWEFALPAGVSAPPIVDEEQIYLPTATTRLFAFYLPFVTTSSDPATASPGESGRSESLVYSRTDAEDRFRPRPVWTNQTNIQLAFRPLQTAEEIVVVSPSGEGMILGKAPREGATSTDLYRFSTEGKISVAPSDYGDTAYIGSDDATLYAINMKTGKLRWRHSTSTGVTRTPTPLEKDVYVTSDREGLARLDRESGDALWRIPRGRGFGDANPEADRFLAANDRFVYASDHSGRLLVLDRKRGVRLSMLDTTAFRVPVVNEVTDRLYLAANDGLILCLHDRDQKTPIRHRRPLEEAGSPLQRRLNQNINDAGDPKAISLRDALGQLRTRYKVHFVIALRAFKEAKMDDPQDKMVTMPRTENKPLKDHLQRLLSQADSTFQVVDQTLLIVPGKPGEKEKEKDKPKEKEKPKEKPKEKDKDKDKDD